MSGQCRHITFEQFVKLAFENEIPQFIEDFFMHMTTLSYRELVRKQTLMSLQRLTKNKNTSSKVVMLPNETLDDAGVSMRNLQMVRIQQ